MMKKTCKMYNIYVNTYKFYIFFMNRVNEKKEIYYKLILLTSAGYWTSS